jgi:hypothetical protein
MEKKRSEYEISESNSDCLISDDYSDVECRFGSILDGP